MNCKATVKSPSPAYSCRGATTSATTSRKATRGSRSATSCRPAFSTASAPTSRSSRTRSSSTAPTPATRWRACADWSKNLNFPKLLTQENFAWKWDAILLSAGGNDIIAAALEQTGILQNCENHSGPRDFINRTALADLEAHLRACFGNLVKMRNTSSIATNRTIPIYYHTYGYPTPRNAPASVSGPWLYTAFRNKSIPIHYWNDLADALMNELAAMLSRFNNLGTNLRLVDTLDKVPLVRAAAGNTGNSGDWLNEIHLNNPGKDKVAREWAKVL